MIWWCYMPERKRSDAETSPKQVLLGSAVSPLIGIKLLPAPPSSLHNYISDTHTHCLTLYLSLIVLLTFTLFGIRIVTDHFTICFSIPHVFSLHLRFERRQSNHSVNVCVKTIMLNLRGDWLFTFHKIIWNEAVFDEGSLSSQPRKAFPMFNKT